MTVDPDVVAAAAVVAITTILVIRYFYRNNVEDYDGGATTTVIDATNYYLTVAMGRLRIAMSSRAARRGVRRIIAGREEDEDAAEEYDESRSRGGRNREQHPRGDPPRPVVTGIFIHPGKHVRLRATLGPPLHHIGDILIRTPYRPSRPLLSYLSLRLHSPRADR